MRGLICALLAAGCVLFGAGCVTVRVAEIPPPESECPTDADVERLARLLPTLYDPAAMAALEELAGRADAVCFGSLAQRSERSRKTIRRFLGSMRPDATRVFDINLRQSYYSAEVLAESLGAQGRVLAYDVTDRKLEKIRGYWAETPFSLDRPVNDEDGRKFIDFLEEENVPTPYEQLVSRKWSDEVRRLLDTLTPMEARILRWRFGLDDEDELTLKEIGDKYNLSRERIRQLQEQALGKIRRQIKE